MTTRRTWLLVAVLGLVGGCTDFCEGDTVTNAAFARADQYGVQIAKCVQQQRCAPLCADVFNIDGRVETCTITSSQANDLSVVNGPVAPMTDLQTLRGVTLRVVYVERVQCSASDDSAWTGDGYDDGSYDDGDDNTGDDGSCDDSSCDDGNDDGNSGDGGSDDGGGGDDGGGDDGGGDGNFSGAASARHR